MSKEKVDSRAVDLVQRGLLAAQAVCPGCNLKRAPREFGGFKKCGTCRARKR